MTYTISGKEWTEFDINKRCAELMGVKVADAQWMNYADRDENVVITSKVSVSDSAVDYCNNASDTWSIIDKCWDQLIYADYRRDVTWEILMEKHNCTKLIAACICLIEVSEPLK